MLITLIQVADNSEIDVADTVCYLFQSQCTDTGPTSPSTDLTMPRAWQDSHQRASLQIAGVTRPATPRIDHWVPCCLVTRFTAGPLVLLLMLMLLLLLLLMLLLLLFFFFFFFFFLMFVGSLMPQQHASVSQGRVTSDNSTCCHTETLQITLSVSRNHGILTLSRPVPMVIL